MKNLIIIAITAITLATLGACSSSSSQNVQKSNLTFGMIKSQIKKGVTTQAEVVKLLGAPNLVTKNGKGNEVWTYSRQSAEAESGGFGGGAIFFGGSSAFSSSSTSSFDLIITYTKNDVVEDYSVTASQF